MPLRPYIQFYGLLHVNERDGKVTEGLIPPYPCKGLIFSLEERPLARIHNQDFDVKATEGYCMPQCTHSWRMQITGRVSMLGVFFRPGMFRHFFKLPAPELTNRTLDFTDAGAPELKALQQRLQEPTGPRAKAQMVEQFLKQQLTRSSIRPTLTDHALSFLRRQGPGCSVDALTNELGVSGRYFRKVFYQDMGIPPKTFLKINRFNKAFQLLKAEQFDKLSDIAYRMQYYDQSHFIAEFKHFTGTTPLQFLRQERPLHGKIYWREGEGEGV